MVLLAVQEVLVQKREVNNVDEKHLIALNKIVKIYETGNTSLRAVDGISLTIDEGEFVAIVGKSGSGKSTLMNLIGALDVPTSGEYYLNGENVGMMKNDELAEIRNKQIGFVFQQYNLISKLTLLENVELPLLYRGVKEKERRLRAEEALEQMGIVEKKNCFPNQLSGGQQQRVSIARALVGNPSLILADEPTGALDSRTGREMLEIFQELNQRGNTIILITHDKSIACEAQRVIVIKDGKIVDQMDSETYSEGMV